MQGDEITIEQAAEKVKEARERLDSADRQESLARQAKCAALNDFNAAAREFDKVVEKLKKQAPRGTDWNTNMISAEARRS